jgi:hypothetical protein
LAGSSLINRVSNDPKAKAAVEQRIPPGTFHRDAKHNGDREFRRQRAVARCKGKL